SMIGILAQHIGLAEAIGLVALLGYSIAFAATLMLPETRGIQLSSSYEPSAPRSDIGAASPQGQTPALRARR
ncbi:MAG: MFS transporter, partial [Mesorhizobium sp.]